MIPKSITADGGFVRVPRAYLDLDISPGAKVVLMHLCASADDDGESWHSYENIGKILGRSKASVTAYVHELVQLGLVKAIEQKMANGYNYRRRLRLIQWRNLVSHWKGLTAKKKSRDNKAMQPSTEANAAKLSVTDGSGEVAKSPLPTGDDKPTTAASKDTDLEAQKAECCVQNTECKDPSGLNKINKNKTTGPVEPVVWSQNDEQEWRKFRPSDRDPIGNAYGTPAPYLIEKMKRIKSRLENETQLLSPDQSKAEAAVQVRDFCHARGIEANAESTGATIKTLAAMAPTKAAQQAAIGALTQLWKPHWRKLPTTAQMQESLKKPVKDALPDKALMAEIHRLTQRIWIADLHQRNRRK